MKLGNSIIFYGILLLLAVTTCVPAMAQSPVFTLERLTDTDTLHPLAKPIWFTSHGKLGLIWQRPGVGNRPIIGLSPFITPSFLRLSYGFLDGNQWKASPDVVELGPGESPVSDITAFSGTGSAPGILVTQKVIVSTFDSALVARLRPFHVLNNNGTFLLKVDEAELALLPYDSRTPEYLKAYKGWKSSVSAEAKRLHGRVFDEVNGKNPHIAEAKTGDAIINRDNITVETDFSQFSATQADDGRLWLAGVDAATRQMWGIPSDDHVGHKWGARMLLGYGTTPHLLSLSKTHFMIVYVNDKVLNDVGNDKVVATGPVLMRESYDGGKSWGLPSVVSKAVAKLANQSDVCMGEGKTLYVTYA